MILMSSHVSQSFAGQKMGGGASLHIVGSVVYWTAGCTLVAITPALPIDRANGYDHSYRSRTNKPFGSSPDFLTEHSAF